MYAATYLINRIPSRAIGFETPYERWNSRKPDYKFLKVFGCAANALVPYERRKKLFPKSKRMVLVGYTDTGYVLMDIESNEISYHTHVVFDESVVFGDFVEVVEVNEELLEEENEEMVLSAGLRTELMYEEAVNGPENRQWRDAMYEELTNLQRMNTYRIVERP